MNEQQRAAMQMALEALEKATMVYEANDTHPLTWKAITALREALAQPQGEWVDLTEDELLEVMCEMAASNVVNDSVFAKAIIAKFKEKNTPPVVPQGEPVACNHQELERLAEEAECVRLSLDKANIPTADSEGAIYSLWGRVCRFAERTTPPSVEVETIDGHSKHWWQHEINNARAEGYERGFNSGKEATKEKAIRIAVTFGDTGRVIAAAIKGMK